MTSSSTLQFPPLADTLHGFVLRHPRLSMDVERAEALALLSPWHEELVGELGHDLTSFRTAEQIHGCGIAVADSRSASVALGADGLISNDPQVVLGIYVADCAAVYLHDPVRQCIGLVHSGKKGTELGIVPRAIEAMHGQFSSAPEHLVVQISPCIRPPAYEVDFAADIRAQCLAAGVCADHLHDDGLCTSQDLTRFYSYRTERGRTGRMLALLALRRG